MTGGGGGGLGGSSGAGQHMIPPYDALEYDDAADTGDNIDDDTIDHDDDDDVGVTRVRRNVSDFDYNLASANCYSPPGPEMGYSARTVVTYQTELVGTGNV